MSKVTPIHGARTVAWLREWLEQAETDGARAAAVVLVSDDGNIYEGYCQPTQAQDFHFLLGGIASLQHLMLSDLHAGITEEME